MPSRKTGGKLLIMRPLGSCSCCRLASGDRRSSSAFSGAPSPIKMIPLLGTTDARLMSSRAGDPPKACLRAMRQHGVETASGHHAPTQLICNRWHCPSAAPCRGRSACFPQAAPCLGRLRWPLSHQQLAWVPIHQVCVLYVNLPLVDTPPNGSRQPRRAIHSCQFSCCVVPGE